MDCPCCCAKLLPHVNDKGVYWYCVYCREVMPVIKKIDADKMSLEGNDTISQNSI